MNWPDWPAFNRELVSGATRGHDKFEEFEVVVTDPSHPVMKGVPASFKITDELYNYTADPAGTPIEVLAEATSRWMDKGYGGFKLAAHEDWEPI